MDQFIIDGVVIKPPSSYQPVFATTSTADSDRTQDLVMHNTPMGTIAGYDIVWEQLTDEEISTILRQTMNKSSFSFHHKSPLFGWSDASFYASNFQVDAMCFTNECSKWRSLSINFRSIYPI